MKLQNWLPSLSVIRTCKSKSEQGIPYEVTGRGNGGTVSGAMMTLRKRRLLEWCNTETGIYYFLH